MLEVSCFTAVYQLNQLPYSSPYLCVIPVYVAL